MNVLKKIGLVVSAGLLSPLIFFLVFAAGFNKTIGNQEYVKTTVAESGLYKEIGQIIISQSTKDAPKDKIIAKAITKVANENQIQKITEPAIAGVYSWLEGETPKLLVELNLEEIQTAFTNTYKADLEKFANKLPQCSSYQTVVNYDVSTLKCIPPGTDINQLINQSIDQAKANNDVFAEAFTSNGTIDNEEAEKAGIASPVESNLPEQIPMLFQFLQKSWPYMLVLLVLCVVGTILLSKSLLYGLRKVGVTLILSSIGLIIAGLLMKYSIENLVPATDPSANQVPTESIQNIVKTLLGDLSGVWLWPGVVLLVLGIVATVVASIYINKNKLQIDKDSRNKMPNKPVAN